MISAAPPVDNAVRNSFFLTFFSFGTTRTTDAEGVLKMRIHEYGLYDDTTWGG